MGRPKRILGTLVIATVVGCSQTASGQARNQPAVTLLILRFIEGPKLENYGRLQAPTDVAAQGDAAAFIANKDSTLVKCFCHLWVQAARGHTSFETGAAILYDQKADDFYCTTSPPAPKPNQRSIDIPEGAVGTVHTHPNDRVQYPSLEDYDVFRARPGFVLTKSSVWGIAPGCENSRCAHKLTNGDWYRRVCQLVEKRDVVFR